MDMLQEGFPNPFLAMKLRATSTSSWTHELWSEANVSLSFKLFYYMFIFYCSISHFILQKKSLLCCNEEKKWYVLKDSRSHQYRVLFAFPNSITPCDITWKAKIWLLHALKLWGMSAKVGWKFVNKGDTQTGYIFFLGFESTDTQDVSIYQCMCALIIWYWRITCIIYLPRW